MRTSTKVVWLVFGGVVLLQAVYLNFFADDPGDGGGACAMMGFGLLILLLVGTAIERFTSKRKEPPGFDVVPAQKDEGQNTD